jgi:Tfp pilus assembly protein PilF
MFRISANSSSLAVAPDKMVRIVRKCLVLLLMILAASTAATGTDAAGRAEERVIERLIRSDELDSALVLADLAISRDSTHLRIWRLRDDIYRIREDNHGRLITLRETLRHHPSHVGTHLVLAEVFFDSGLVDSAGPYLGYYQQRTGGINARAQYLAGRIHEALGRPDSAIASYRQAWHLLEMRRLY